MLEILDYSKPEKKAISWRDHVDVAVYAACVVIYFVACGAAMGQRGYPPLELHLQGMTLLWVGGVVLAARTVAWTRVHAWSLVGYAFVTGYIDAASWPQMVPNRFDPVMTLMATMIIFAPLHLTIGLLLEVATRAGGVFAKCIIRREKLRTVIAVSVTLMGTAMLPSAYAGWKQWSLDRGRARIADADWARGEARRLSRDYNSEELQGELAVQFYWDRTTGLLNRPEFRRGWENGYKKRIAELLLKDPHGGGRAPVYPSGAELGKIALEKDHPLVTVFPYPVSAGVTVMNNEGAIRAGTDWNWDMKGSSELRAWRDQRYAGVVYVGNGDGKLEVLTEDGRELAEVSRQ